MNKPKKIDASTLLTERIDKIVENNKNDNGRVISIKTDRITELRKMEGFNSAKEFAKYIEDNLGGFVSKSLIESLETTDNSKKKKPLTIDMALRFAKAFNVSPDWLFGISDDMNNKSSNIEIALRELFNFKTTKSQFQNEEGSYYSEDFLTFSLDEPLYNLLMDIREISQMRDKGRITEDTYTSAINDLRQQYDKEKAIKNSDIKSASYVLVPANHRCIIDNLV